MSAERTAPLLNLPDELILQILALLDFDTLHVCVAATCRRLRDVSLDASLHRLLYVPEYWSEERVIHVLSMRQLQDNLLELKLPKWLRVSRVLTELGLKKAVFGRVQKVSLTYLNLHVGLRWRKNELLTLFPALTALNLQRTAL